MNRNCHRLRHVGSITHVLPDYVKKRDTIPERARMEPAVGFVFGRRESRRIASRWAACSHERVSRKAEDDCVRNKGSKELRGDEIEQGCPKTTGAPSEGASGFTFPSPSCPIVSPRKHGHAVCEGDRRHVRETGPHSNWFSNLIRLCFYFVVHMWCVLGWHAVVLLGVNSAACLRLVLLRYGHLYCSAQIRIIASLAGVDLDVKVCGAEEPALASSPFRTVRHVWLRVVSCGPVA